MSRRRLGLALVAGFAAALWSAGAEAATKQQLTAKIKQADTALKKAGTLFNKQKFEEAAALVQEAQGLLSEVNADPNGAALAKAVAPVHARLKKAYGLLELEGIALSPLDEPGAAPAPGQISFVKQVAPLIMSKCGRCHVNDDKGGLSMATFEMLEKGNDDGVVVMPGKGSGSRIIEVIESGDMPRGGGKVAPEELALLTKWIDQGAKFDGKSKKDQLTLLVPNVAPTEEVRLEVSKSTGKETISFAKDIAPVLVDNCLGCHGGMDPRANLNMDTFAGLLRGGESGAPIAPKNVDASLLNDKIKGESGARMPLNKLPLATDVIAKFDKWVAEGGTFDGPDPGMLLSRLVAIVFAQNATHEELAKRRFDQAQRTWRLAIPDDAAQTVDTENFLLMGNVEVETLTEIGQTAEAQVAAVARMLKAPATGPLVKGKVTLFVFRQRFDYTEFGRMVEKRELPADWKGHWKFDIVSAYGALVAPREEDGSIDGLIAQILGSVYVFSVGNAPEWFAEGVGRTIAARVAPKDPRIAAWERHLPTAMSSAGKPDALLMPGLPPEDSAVLSYSFVRYLMSNAKFAGLLNSLKQGAAFDQAVMKNLGRTPQQLVMDWGSKAGGTRPGRRRP